MFVSTESPAYHTPFRCGYGFTVWRSNVFLPTLAGNRLGDAKHVGLEEAIQSRVDFFTAHDIHDAILVGHSYGGMVMTGAADRVPQRLRRLVYWKVHLAIEYTRRRMDTYVAEPTDESN